MNFFLTYSSVPDVNICISVEVGLIITKMDTQNGEIWALSALLKVKHKVPLNKTQHHHLTTQLYCSSKISAWYFLTSFSALGIKITSICVYQSWICAIHSPY